MRFLYYNAIPKYFFIVILEKFHYTTLHYIVLHNEIISLSHSMHVFVLHFYPCVFFFLIFSAISVRLLALVSNIISVLHITFLNVQIFSKKKKIYICSSILLTRIILLTFICLQIVSMKF